MLICETALATDYLPRGSQVFSPDPNYSTHPFRMDENASALESQPVNAEHPLPAAVEHSDVKPQIIKIKTDLQADVNDSAAVPHGIETKANSHLVTEHKMDSRAKKVDFNVSAFLPDPDYADHAYQADAQLGVYKERPQHDEPFYFSLYGRGLFPSRQFNEGLDIIGKKNELYPNLIGSGDLRLAYVYSDDGADSQAEIATRLNLDIDLQLTATERLHAFVRPFDRNGKFSRFSFNDNGFADKFHGVLDFEMDGLFFEGDLGAILSGLTDTYMPFDLPFAVGLMPMIFQNGIWLNDIFKGAAFTISAKNSPMLDISNMDITFFFANAEINSPVSAQLNAVKLYGFNAFIESLNGYLEIGYAYTKDEDLSDADQSYHNIMVSYSHRLGNLASVSYRVLHNFGQQARPGQLVGKTADGTLLLLETSYITSKPYTLIPYLNLFYGAGRPQSVARIGGILQNTGILFEADGMTAFPTMEATANDTWGGALGIEYLFDLNQQIIVEAALVKTVQGFNKPGRNAKGDEIGIGIRYQRPLSDSIILRFDSMFGYRQKQANIWGGRSELRWKF